MATLAQPVSVACPGLQRGNVGRCAVEVRAVVAAAGLTKLPKGNTMQSGLLATAATRDRSTRADARGSLAPMKVRHRGQPETAPDAMMVMNPRGEILLLNFLSEKPFRYLGHKLAGYRLADIICRGVVERRPTNGSRFAQGASGAQ
jgi:hypothetical protein